MREWSKTYAEDTASGQRDTRPGLDACLKALRSGDTLVVWKLDRLGRDLRHLVNLVGELTRRQIGLKVLAGEGASIHTTTANDRLIFAILVGLLEEEGIASGPSSRATMADVKAEARRRFDRRTC